MLERRSILKAGLAAGLIPALASAAKAQEVDPTGSAARAQDADRSRDVMQTIATAKGQAENVLAVALYSNLSAGNGKVIESANERIFKDLTAVLGGIPAEEATLYAEPAQAMLAEQMTERGVAVVPEAAAPVIPGGASEGSGELIDVVGDIIKDAFGVKDLNVQGLMQIATELAVLDFISRIGGMIRANNWALAAEFLRALLTQLGAAASAIPAIQKALGEQAVKEILTAVSARFVPFLGWPILIASILFAVMKHKNRLLSALEKAH
jgi:hypothetical protein